MTRPALTILACISLFGCSAIPSIPDPALADLRAQIREHQQQQQELKGILNDLSAAQADANEHIKSELTKTQEMLAGTRAQQRSEQSGSDNSPTQSKAEWLQEEGKVLVGGVENITFTAENITYQARIDTGATSSSIDAREVSRFERDGDRWVRFKLYDGDKHLADVERPVVRWVRIYQSGSEDGERRPVVELSYRFGNLEDTSEFTLTDRSHLEYPALVGRNIMTDQMIVDVSDSYLFDKD